MKQPYFAGTYGSCILVEREQSRGREQNSNSAKSDARNYQLKQKLVAPPNNTGIETYLPHGIYRIRVRSHGFEEFRSEPFDLSSGETKAFDVTLNRPMASQYGIPEPPLEDPLDTAQTKGTKRLVPFKTILLGQNSGMREAQKVIVTNQLEWENLWNKIYPTRTPRPEPPNIDFNNKIVIASALGQRNTGGFSIEIIRAVETEAAIELWVKTQSWGGPVTLAFTEPLHVIEMERVDKKISFVRPRYQSPCL